jgi:hypothetical protein
MHVDETVVHHISPRKMMACGRLLFVSRDAPRLAQIHIDEDTGHGPTKERTALWVKPLVENLNLWIGDEEDVSRRLSESISLMSTPSQLSRGEKMRRLLYYSWIWPSSTPYIRNDKDTDFET